MPDCYCIHVEIGLIICDKVNVLQIDQVNDIVTYLRPIETDGSLQ